MSHIEEAEIYELQMKENELNDKIDILTNTIKELEEQIEEKEKENTELKEKLDNLYDLLRDAIKLI